MTVEHTMERNLFVLVLNLIYIFGIWDGYQKIKADKNLRSTVWGLLLIVSGSIGLLCVLQFPC